MRHCNALFRKHVFPVLFNPQPTGSFCGHDVSIVPVYSEVLLELAAGALFRRCLVDGDGRGF